MWVSSSFLHERTASVEIKEEVPGQSPSAARRVREEAAAGGWLGVPDGSCCGLMGGRGCHPLFTHSGSNLQVYR